MRRYETIIRWVAVGIIIVSLFLIMGQLPIKQMTEALAGWIDGLGVWGPIVFGVFYILAVLALMPGGALTLAAGAIFGLLQGTIVVSLASTTSAALAFLMARYVARDRVAKMLADYPKFKAIDRAVSQGGWKIVAMLRLSPAVPFNLQNYLYGVTGIGFLPTVLTSWVAMLPGTLMYVYLGYIAREGAAAAAGVGDGGDGGGATDYLKLALQIVGLLATIGVTIYITRIANKALKEQTDIDSAASDEAPSDPTEVDRNDEAPTSQSVATGLGRSTWILAGVAAAALSLAISFKLNPQWIQGALVGLFGPPKVVMKEAYPELPDGPGFDHSRWDAILKQAVDEQGQVDYQGLRKAPTALDDYVASLATAPFDAMGRNEKLALLINAYNAFTLRLIVDHWPVDSIKAIPSAQRWDAVRWRVGESTWSLSQIEHDLIRTNFIEPRIHFALVCAAKGCPPLLREAYTGQRLEEQLEFQTQRTHRDARWLGFNVETGELQLTKLYQWYADDFRQVAGSIEAYAARYSPALQNHLDGGGAIDVQWLEYDWSLNGQP